MLICFIMYPSTVPPETLITAGQGHAPSRGKSGVGAARTDC